MDEIYSYIFALQRESMDESNFKLNTISQKLINYCDEGIAVISAEGLPKYISPSIEKILGYTVEEILNLDIFSLLHADDIVPVSDVIQRAIAQPGVSIKGHPSRMRHKDGTWKWLDATVTNLLHDPEVNGIVDIFHDITGIRSNEDKIQHANRLYAFISQINQAIVHVKSEQELFDEACRISVEFGKFTAAWISSTDTANMEIRLVAQSGIKPADLHLFKVYKYTVGGPQDFVARTGEYFVCNDVENDPTLAPWKDYTTKEGIKSCMVMPVKRYGKVIGAFNIHASEVDFFDTDEIALLKEAAGDISFALDVFEKERLRQAAEDKLKYSDVRLREAQAIAKTGSWISDLRTQKVDCSEEIYHILETDIGGFGGTREGFLKYIHPDDRQRVENAFLQTEKENKLTNSIEYRLITAKGNEKHIFENWLLHHDENGTATQAVGTSQDITEKKKEELHKEQITNELIQRNKDLEQFSYMVSHNLRSSVANILGLTELLQKEEQDSREQRSMLEYLENSAKKLDSTIKDLNYVLQVKSNIHERKEKIVFSELLSDILQNVSQHEHAGEVSISSNFDVIDEMVNLKSYMYSIFYNLISNSIKYRRTDVQSTIHISTSIENEKIVLTFADNGLGIDLEKTGDNIFGIYKRFHNHIEGKGLGLFMVKTQVNVLDGEIEVESEVDKGTIFRITFNAVEENSPSLSI